MTTAPDISPAASRRRFFAARLLLISLAVIIPAVWIPLRPPSYDPSNIHEVLKNVRLPCQWAKASYFFDGGSIGVELVDAESKNLKLALPVGNIEGDHKTYPRLFTGTVHTSKPGGVEVPCGKDDRLFIANLIENYAEAGFDRDFSLLYLRGAPRDRLRLWIAKFSKD